MLLKNPIRQISMVCPTDEDVLISEVLQVASFDKEFWAICNLEIWVLIVVALCGSWHDCTLDDRGESIGQFVEYGFND